MTTFICCKNCGHSEHENKCEENALGIRCSCKQYQKQEIQTIDDLIEEIHTTYKRYISMSEEMRNKKEYTIYEFQVRYSKLIVLQNRFNEHFGMMNYYQKANPLD